MAANNIVEEIWESVFQPGVPNERVTGVFLGAFYALFLSLAFLLVMTKGNIHVILLLALSVLLYLSIVWFITEARRVEKLEKLKKEQNKDDEDDEDEEKDDEELNSSIKSTPISKTKSRSTTNTPKSKSKSKSKSKKE